jgi:glucose/mannose-6-phosphate isomerase
MTTDQIRALDPADMLGHIRAFPDHLADGWARGAATADFGWRATGFDAVVVCGMGGSAIGGDLMRTFVEAEAPVPVQVVRGYTLPGFVSGSTLVVVSSYSGGTEETLSCYADARARGATVLAITSGGEVQRRADEADDRLIEIPGGMQPRAALGFSLGVLLRLAREIGLAAIPDEDFDAAVDAARARSERLGSPGSASNDAVTLARTLHEKLAVVYSGPGLLEAVNMRWRTQIHENAKAPAVGNLLPELDHNEIMGYEAAPDPIASQMAVVVLRDGGDHPQIHKRMDATRDLVQDGIASWTVVDSEGPSQLGRMLSLLQLGDFVSFYLAMLQEVDPTPVETIQQLKKTLAP